MRNLKYYFKNKSNPISFNNINCTIGLNRKINDDFIALEKARENWIYIYIYIYISSLNETARGKWKNNLEVQKPAMKNVELYYESREKVINFFDDYRKIVSKAKYKEKHGMGF